MSRVNQWVRNRDVIIIEIDDLAYILLFSVNVVPDSLLMQLIRERLNQKDCITKGWVMIGFPRTVEQADSLARLPNIAPNR